MGPRKQMFISPFQVDDVRTKGKDALQPRADMIKEQIAPVRTWVRRFPVNWYLWLQKYGFHFPSVNYTYNLNKIYVGLLIIVSL